MTKKTIIITVGFFSIFAVLSRLFPHLPNVAPVTGLALFASAYLGIGYSIGVVFIAMFVSDLFVGFYAWPIMLSVYGAFFLASILGGYLKKHKSLLGIGVATLSASLLFFIITNTAVWIFGTMYPHTLNGLAESYFMGLPFFRNSLIGDIIYTGVFFGIYEVAVLLSKKSIDNKRFI